VPAEDAFAEELLFDAAAEAAEAFPLAAAAPDACESPVADDCAAAMEAEFAFSDAVARASAAAAAGACEYPGLFDDNCMRVSSAHERCG
jgi:hypothetical protein